MRKVPLLAQFFPLYPYIQTKASWIQEPFVLTPWLFCHSSNDLLICDPFLNAIPVLVDPLALQPLLIPSLLVCEPSLGAFPLSVDPLALHPLPANPHSPDLLGLRSLPPRFISALPTEQPPPEHNSPVTRRKHYKEMHHKTLTLV